MKTLSRYSRKLLDEAQWRAPVWMQRFTTSYLSLVRDHASIVLKPYLTTYYLKGQGAGGPITITYVGLTDIFKPYLESILFLEKPVEEEIGRVPFWCLGKFLDTPTSDLTFIAASKYLTRKLPGQNAIVLPFLVNQTLDVGGEWGDVRQRFHRKLRGHELRLVRKYGYKYEISNKDEDFELFFRQMYLPSMRMRHSHQAHVVSYTAAYQLFKKKEAFLILVKRDGTYVSGGLCHTKPEPGVVHFRFVGVLNCDQQLMKEGAQGAVYYGIIHWANQYGYEAVDFEATEPYLGKGIFQHKRKWGACARLLPNIHRHKRVWIKIHRNTPAVSRFMKDHPCIIVNGQGNLQGLFVTDNPDNVPPETKREWDKLCASPGLEGYLVRSVEDFLD